MSALHQKLQRLKQKQLEVEKQLAAQAAIENAAVAKAFDLILSTSAGAYKSAQTSPALDSLSTRERTAFDNWLGRIAPPSAQTAPQTTPEAPRSTETHPFGSTTS